MKTLAVTGIIASTVLTSTVLTGISPADAATGCGSLPGQVQGSPNVQPGSRGVAYLWHDAHGWSLRVTHPGTAKAVVTGTITVTRDISHLQTVRLERGDAVAVSRDGHTLSFRMTNVGHLDGVNFTAECSPQMRVNVRVNGAGASTSQVFLGAHRVHPTSVPFTIERS